MVGHRLGTIRHSASVSAKTDRRPTLVEHRRAKWHILAPRRSCSIEDSSSPASPAASSAAWHCRAPPRHRPPVTPLNDRLSLRHGRPHQRAGALDRRRPRPRGQRRTRPERAADHGAAAARGPRRSPSSTPTSTPSTPAATKHSRQAGATIVAHENTRLWMATPTWLPAEDRYRPPRPKDAHPTKTFYTTGTMQAAANASSTGT